MPRAFPLSMWILTTLILALAPSAHADEADAETRFHEAYVLEVVDGKVADAARVYLALALDEATPPRIRAEAKFRFAVTTVLLGRADEARAGFAELIRDEGTPESVKARAEEYLTTLAGVGTGTELDKKLQTLIFDLGRESAHKTPAAYRDFEIIGKAALPLLRELLEHPDQTLRIHALRLLTRLDDPDLVELWSPDLGFYASVANDFNAWLHRHPDARGAVETMLLALDDEALVRVVKSTSRPRGSFSLDFVRALADRSATHKYAGYFLDQAGDPEERWALAREWVESGDEALANGVARMILYEGRMPPESVSAALYPDVVRRALAWELPWSPNAHPQPQRRGHLLRYTQAQSSDVVLRVLEDVLAAGRTWVKDGHARHRSPLLSGVLDVIAQVLDERPSAEVDLAAYDAWVRAVIDVMPGLRKSLIATGYNPGIPGDGFLAHIRYLLEHLPRDEKLDLVTFLFEGPDAGWDRNNPYVRIFQVAGPQDVEPFVRALEVSRAGDRAALLDRLPRAFRGPAPPAAAKATLDILVRAAPLLDLDQIRSHYVDWAWFARIVPEQAASTLSALLDTVFEHLQPQIQMELFESVFSPGGKHKAIQLAFLLDPGLGVLAEHWSRLPRDHHQRARLLDRVAQYLLDIATLGSGSPGGRERIAEFLRARLDEAGQKVFKVAARNLDLFPPATWIPLASPAALAEIRGLEEGPHDELARSLTRDPSKVNHTVLQFVRRASPATCAEIFDRLLASEDESARSRAIHELDHEGRPATVAGLEGALERLLAERNAPWRQWAKVVLALVEVRPSEKLFPAARVLMKSQEPGAVRTGIQVAKALGRQELVPDLRALLDSMDPKTRGAALEAVRSIDELTRQRAWESR